MSDQSTPFYQEFRAEADDLLAQIRRVLGGVRGARGVAQRDLISALLRQFHTLKGLTGMVGLKQAGQLTHLIESYLLEHQSQLLDESTVVHLAAATRELEGLIIHPEAASDAVGRYQQLFATSGPATTSVPAPSGEGKDWQDTLPEDVRAVLTPSDLHLVEEGLSEGRGLSLVLFASSAEKAERGVKVNDIREALGTRADLVRVVPRVSGRDVCFAFLLSTPAGFQVDDLEIEREELVAPGPSPSAQPVAQDEPLPFLSSSSLRVGTERLDEVVRLVEGLVVSRYRLEQRLGEAVGLANDQRNALRETSGQMQRQLRDLTEALMRVRMVPIGDVLGRLPLIARELGHESGKPVELVLTGEETRVDKNVVERLMDPLLHLVRNAVAHGLEAPTERERAGKPEVGRIKISAHPDGNSIVLTVSDDGRGLDPEKLKARARAQGLEGGTEGPGGLLDLICQPGFSTREEAGMDAGRGVGMPIVRDSVEAVGGSLRLQSEPGFGTTFQLRLPLSTSIVDALLIEAAGSTFAIPTQDLHEVVDLADLPRTRLRSAELVKHRGASLRLHQLPHLLSLEGHEKGGRLALIYGRGDSTAAFAVDRISGLREVVVRTFGDPLVVRPWFLGATELGDGRLILILHLPELLRRAA